MKFLALACLAAALPAQQIDLARYFFATPAAERDARHDLDAELVKLEALRGKLSAKPENLATAFRLRDRIQVIRNHHMDYLHLVCDLMDRTTCGEEGALNAMVSKRWAFLGAEIQAMPDSLISRFLDEDAGLRPYRFAIERLRRDQSNAMPVDRQELLASVAPAIGGWQWDLYNQIVTHVRASAAAPSASLDPDARREQQFHQRYRNLKEQRDLLAFTLMHVVQAGSLTASLAGFTNTPDRRYHGLFFDPAEVRRLLAAARQHGDTYKRFQAILIADAQKRLGREPAPWEMQPPDLGAPRATPDEARRILHDALNGLGERYVQELDALLDPVNGRASMQRGGRSGGYSLGGVGATTVFIAGAYSGTLANLDTIAHEATHAVHRSLMTAHGVLPFYGTSFNYFSESFASFAELLLVDDFVKRAPNAELRRYYEVELLRDKGLDFLLGAQDAAVEQAIFDGVGDGSIKGADDLDRVTGEIDREFSVWPAKYPEMNARWEETRLFYQDPIYEFNYLYGGLLALKYYQLYQADRAWFVPRYVALMENGFDAPPDALLKKFLNVDLRGDSLLKDGLSVVEKKLHALEASR